MGIQESLRVYEHMALKVKTIVSWPRSLCSNLLVHWLDTLPMTGIRSTKGVVDLGLARIVGFHSCFSCITLCKKLLKGKFFRKIGLINEVKVVLQSQGFFRRPQTEESF